MAGTFDVLRANDLIFNYVVSNWLMGQDPPAFDILAWNADSTRMPAAMHAFYLRNFYVENKLAAGSCEIGGPTIDLERRSSRPTYVVSAINDHIVPWRSAYKTTATGERPGRVSSSSSGGHIAGIVNPPGPKAWYMAADELPATGDEWRRKARTPQRLVVGGLGELVGRRPPASWSTRRRWAATPPGAGRRPGRRYIWPT